MSTRKLLALALVAGPPLAGLCGPALAGTWSDLWSTHEQQGQRLLDGNHPNEAAQLFSDPKRRAYAEAQAGQYGKAAELLAPLKDANSQYNRGNALARSGKLQDALAAYDAALAASPGNEDVLRNRDLVAKALENQQPQQGKDGAGKNGKEDKSGSKDSGSQDGKSGQDQRQADQRGQSGQQGQSGNQAQANAQNQPRGTGQTQSGQQNQAGNQQQGTNPATAGQQAQTANPSQSGNAAQAQNPQQGAGALASNPPGQHDQHNATALQQGQTSGTGTQRGPESLTESPLVKGGAASNAQQSQPRSEQALALDQWMRSIPDDSGELLRRKFQIEHLMKQQGNEQ